MAGPALIAQIRREKFWLDRDDLQANPLISDLQASVTHLSEGLYSKETHFVLELLQNAEDNSYDEGVTPRLCMELLDVDPLGTPGSDGALAVSNNERGFQPADVRALCAVGASTKKARKNSAAFIGDKGIGFKSVFVVSARPAIFSNGFHFRFDEAPEASTGLGYIVPSAIAAVPAAVRPHLAAGHTVILLPLKPGKRAKVERELASIAPETLLFLRKIASLRVVLNGRVLAEVERRARPPPGRTLPDAGRGCEVVSLLARAGGEQAVREYWLCSLESQVPAELAEPSRAGVRARTCAVALPLRSGAGAEESGGSGTPACSGRVYAFLPTEVTRARAGQHDAPTRSCLAGGARPPASPRAAPPLRRSELPSCRPPAGALARALPAQRRLCPLLLARGHPSAPPVEPVAAEVPR